MLEPSIGSHLAMHSQDYDFCAIKQGLSFFAWGRNFLETRKSHLGPNHSPWRDYKKRKEELHGTQIAIVNNLGAWGLCVHAPCMQERIGTLRKLDTLCFSSILNQGIVNMFSLSFMYGGNSSECVVHVQYAPSSCCTPKAVPDPH